MAHTPEKPFASKLKRIYAPRLISDHIMVQEDFERLHKFLLETEGLSEVSDDMRESLPVCLSVKPVGEPDALIGYVRFDG